MMAKLTVVHYGHPVLRTPTEPIHKASAKIQKLAEEMLDLMYEMNGVGLAAPQVGVSKRLCVLDCSSPEQKLPTLVLINPRIVQKKGVCLSYEGCLSFPEVFAEVKRYASITVRYQDLKGRTQDLSVSVETHPLLTRALQHEIDHLDGIVFVDHILAERFAETNASLVKNGLPPINEGNLRHEADLDALIAETPSLKDAVIR